MKKLLPLFLFIALTCSSWAQFKIGFLAGANRSTIIETNNLPNWNTIKPNYAVIYGYHGGIISDIPLNSKGNLVLEPGVIYYNKGRKYLQKFDSAVSFTRDSSFKQQLNYIDIPLNLILKFRLSDKIKFFLGGGPYASFFFKGSEKTVTSYYDNTVVSSTNNDLPVGNAPGKYKTMDYGVNVTAGFEIGKAFLRADASQSLADMYQAANYKGSFKNQVIAVSLGFNIDIKTAAPAKKKVPEKTTPKTKKPKTETKKPEKIKDKDGDGVLDKDDQCPTEFGSKDAMGCPDRDGDGVPDKDDKCPDVKGLASNHGCPAKDSDGDGVPDDIDQCPLVKGNVKNNGCPLSVKDTDGDGINDYVDKCPDVPGLLRYNGCPIPDTDGDGVNDEIDHCKDVPGLKTNHGCPEKTREITKEVSEKVKYNANRIQFELKKAELLPSSLAALDNMVQLLNKDQSLKLSIEGHASMEGSYFTNLKLSEDRAAAVKNYLVSKGIDAGRLNTIGYGSARVLTIAEDQQAMNRRVEMKLSY